MNSKATLESAAVAASAPVTLATAGVGQTLISMAVGLVGVWLARIVFVNRENSKLKRQQTTRETLPVTLAACLIAGAVIYDQHLGISTAAFLGLGTGWTTVLLLEFFGDNILNAMRALTGREPMSQAKPPAKDVFDEKYSGLTDEMKQLLREIDHAASHPTKSPPSQE